MPFSGNFLNNYIISFGLIAIVLICFEKLNLFTEAMNSKGKQKQLDDTIAWVFSMCLNNKM